MTAKVLAAVYIGQVHLDKRYCDRGQCVPQGHAGMCKCRRIDDNEVAAPGPGVLDLIDQLVFGITLEADQFMAMGLGQFCQMLVDGIQGLVAVMVRLTLTEQIQVWSVKYQYRCHCCYYAVKRNKSSSITRYCPINRVGACVIGICLFQAGMSSNNSNVLKFRRRLA